MTASALAQLSYGQSLHGLKTENLLETCKKGLTATDPSKDVNFVYCEGFVAAVSDARSLMHGVPVQLCVPSDVTGTQMVKIVEKYGKEHPEDLHLPAASLVAKALLQVYPCASKPK